MTRLGACVRRLRCGRLGKAMRAVAGVAVLLALAHLAGGEAGASVLPKPGGGIGAGVILAGCVGPECGMPPGPGPEGVPEGACRPEGHGGGWGAYGPGECGIRCMYERLRNGFCGPGCDYYLFRMNEYRNGRIFRPRRCNNK